MAHKNTVTVRVAGEDRAVSWADGHFAGDQRLVDAAKRLAAARLEIEVARPGGVGVAGEDTRQGAMVAMLGAAGARGLVVETDPELWDGIVDDVADADPDVIY